MLTQEDKIKKLASSREEEIKYFKDVIKAAARYERLMVLQDFKDLIQDLRNLVKVHETEINGWQDLTEGMSMFKRLRTYEVINVHVIRRNQLREAIGYPEKIMHAAREAREGLRLITEEGTSNA